MFDNYFCPRETFWQAAHTALSLPLNLLWPSLFRHSVCSAVPSVRLDIPHLSSGRWWSVEERLLRPETRSLTSAPWARSWMFHMGLYSHLGMTTNQAKLQLYLYRLNPKWGSRLEIDPLLLKAELRLWDNKCAYTGGSWCFLSSEGFAWSIYVGSSCWRKMSAGIETVLLSSVVDGYRGEWHISHSPCDGHFVGPLLCGEKCSPLLGSVGESLASFLSLSVRLRLKTSANSCRESSVVGGAGGGGSSANDWSVAINKPETVIWFQGMVWYFRKYLLSCWELDERGLCPKHEAQTAAG